MISVSVISVPGSGTWFVLYLLAHMGVRWRHAHIAESWEGSPEARALLEAGDPILVPLRDPCLIAASNANTRKGNHVRKLRMLAEIADRLDVETLRVDVEPEGRAAELARVGSLLGVQPPEDYRWEPENVHPDRLGLKTRYLAGEMPDELRAAHEIAREPAIRRLLDRGG